VVILVSSVPPVSECGERDKADSKKRQSISVVGNLKNFAERTRGSIRAIAVIFAPNGMAITLATIKVKARKRGRFFIRR
jgi:hypothetical protein